MVRSLELVLEKTGYEIRLTLNSIAVLILMALLLSSSPAHAQGGFKCIPVFYQVLSGQLNEYDPTSGNYNPLGPDYSNYNAMGYNALDGYIYGMHSGKVVRIDSTGTLVNLGAPVATDGTTGGIFVDEPRR